MTQSHNAAKVLGQELTTLATCTNSLSFPLDHPNTLIFTCWTLQSFWHNDWNDLPLPR